MCSLNFSSHNKGERNTLGHGSEVPSLDSHPQAAGSLEWQCKDILGDFSGGSEVKTLCSPCKGLGLIPGQGTRSHMLQPRPGPTKATFIWLRIEFDRVQINPLNLFVTSTSTV